MPAAFTYAGGRSGGLVVGRVGRPVRSTEGVMQQRRRDDLDTAGNGGHAGDCGATFVELLVAIVLLGTAVIATLVALQAATTGSTIDASQARALVFLQSASDEIFNEPRVSCTRLIGSDPSLPSSWANNKGSKGVNAPGTVWTAYESVLSSVPRPEGWASASIEITDITFLGRPTVDATFFEWGAGYCFEGVQPDGPDADGDPEDYRQTPLLSQKVTIRVTSPNGRIVKTIETVKGER